MSLTFWSLLGCSMGSPAWKQQQRGASGSATEGRFLTERSRAPRMDQDSGIGNSTYVTYGYYDAGKDHGRSP